MRLVFRLRQDSDGQASDRGATALMSPLDEMHLDQAGAPGHLADTLEGALRLRAALRAAYPEDVGVQLPDEPGHPQQPIAPPPPSPSEEQALREELLANDSLGG